MLALLWTYNESKFISSFIEKEILYISNVYFFMNIWYSSFIDRNYYNSS